MRVARRPRSLFRAGLSAISSPRRCGHAESFRRSEYLFETLSRKRRVREKKHLRAREAGIFARRNDAAASR